VVTPKAPDAERAARGQSKWHEQRPGTAARPPGLEPAIQTDADQRREQAANAGQRDVQSEVLADALVRREVVVAELPTERAAAAVDAKQHGSGEQHGQ